MKTNYFLVSLCVYSFFLVNAQRICNDCFVQKNGKAMFACFQQKCDSFLWPRDTPLPTNLQCNFDSNNKAQSSCYVLNGLDSTGEYHKFISLNQFTRKITQLNQNGRENLSFTFQQLNSRLIITADSSGNKYQGQLISQPGIEFKDVQEALSNNQFKILSKTGQSIKLKIGFYTIELKNSLLKSITQLKTSFQKLQQKLNYENIRKQQQTNTRNGQRFRRLQIQNDQLRNEIAKLNKKFNQLNTTSIYSKNQVDLISKQLSHTNSKLTLFEKNDIDFRIKLTAADHKIQEFNKFVGDYNKNATSQNIKVAAVQQRVANNDMTISQLRQMLSSVDRRFAQLENILHTHKNATSQFQELIIKQLQNLNISQSASLGQLIESINNQNGQSVAQKLTAPNRTEQKIETSFSVHALNQYDFAQLSNYSQVVTSQEEILTIQNFFSPKKIIKMELLYRASQNDFSAAKFHKLCDRIPDTLVLLETEFNKKIGGFTPLLWDGSKNGEYISDLTGQSFIFSLTNKDKFTLEQKEKAIRNHINYGPIFGGGADLLICDEANQKALSYTDISRSYLNPKYKQIDRASWEKLCGNLNNSWHFKMKEWEVWRVQFDSGQKDGAQVSF